MGPKLRTQALSICLMSSSDFSPARRCLAAISRVVQSDIIRTGCWCRCPGTEIHKVSACTHWLKHPLLLLRGVAQVAVQPHHSALGMSPVIIVESFENSWSWSCRGFFKLSKVGRCIILLFDRLGLIIVGRKEIVLVALVLEDLLDGLAEVVAHHSWYSAAASAREPIPGEVPSMGRW